MLAPVLKKLNWAASPAVVVIVKQGSMLAAQHVRRTMRRGRR
jgi:hypothetical protein